MNAHTPISRQTTSDLGALNEIRKNGEGKNGEGKNGEAKKEGATSLRLSFEHGAVAELSASLLWMECRSADGVLRRLNGVPAPDNLTITALQAVGDYAINIAFSDGEVRGIYPFSFLTDLAAQELAVRQLAGPGLAA